MYFVFVHEEVYISCGMNVGILCNQLFTPNWYTMRDLNHSFPYNGTREIQKPIHLVKKINIIVIILGYIKLYVLCTA